ncbi:MAG: prolyl oligopeptidase family serine peptidase [Phycisphaerae bacterium]
MHRIWTRAALFVVCLAIAPAAVLADAPPRTHDITPDDYFTLHFIYDCATSPDGTLVAFNDLCWGEDDTPRQFDMWIVHTDTKRLLRLTAGPENEMSPQWQPDSQRLYFTTKRDRGDKLPPYDGSTQVWVMRLEAGEPLPVTRVKGGVGAYQLSPDGACLYYTKDGEEATGEWKELRGKYKDVKYGSGPVTYTELWKLDLETWREEKLVAEERVIREFKVSPDEARIAMITTPDNRLITNEGQSRVDVYDAATRQVTVLPEATYRENVPSPYGWVSDLSWSSDGQRLAWMVDYDGFPSEILIADLSGAETPVWMLDRPNELTVAGHLTWVPGERGLAFLAVERGRARIYYLDNVSPGRQNTETAGALTPGDVVVKGFSFSADGNSVGFVMADTMNCPDVYLARAKDDKGKYTRLTTFNPQVDTWRLPQISLMTWTAPDGTEVEGVLELPPDYKEGDGPLPTVIELHGGPTDCTYLEMRFWIYGRTLLPAKGYALLSPNYRGSTGYGDKFLTDLVGHENDVDVKDILAGVDALVERGIADPERLGVMGWSNGGFLTNVLITTTTRFKAASTGAGVVDQVMQWGLEDTPGHVVNYMRGMPWERADAYVKASAVYNLGNVKTATLIHVGEKDPRVPTAHCRTLYRGLKDYVGVPTALLVYPGAGHGLVVKNHRAAKMAWDLAWFDKYLRGEGETPEP